MRPSRVWQARLRAEDGFDAAAGHGWATRLALGLAGALLLGVAAPAAAVPSDDDVTKILDQHCARCHQEGKLVKRDAPASGFGFVLDLNRLEKEKLILPGNADNSKLFQHIIGTLARMPYDINDGQCITLPGPPGVECGLDKQETQLVRDWINGRVKSEPVVRKFISDSELIAAMAADLNTVSDARRSTIRYFTLTNLYNAGDDDGDIEVYRQALSKLLNSLSTESDPVTPYAFGPGKTILRVDIRDLGWDAYIWDLVVKIDPYVILYDDPLFDFLSGTTHTPVPWVRGDWFTFVAARPPLYYDILRLPKTLAELEKQVGVDSFRDIDNQQVARAGFRNSGVSENNRLIERHRIATGAYWQSYDFASNDGRKSLLTFPLGPQGTLGDFSKEFGFIQDGGEFIFSLPNGFHGYYLVNAKGERLNEGPINIVQDSTTVRKDRIVINGLSCMGCHIQGMKDPASKDQIRDLVLSSTRLPGDAQKIVEEIYPKDEDMKALIAGDKKRYADALARAGIPDGSLKSSRKAEMVNAVNDRFEKDVTLRDAAAELGFEPQQLIGKLNSAGNEFYELRSRLEQDNVPRDEFVAVFADVVNKITRNKGVDFTKVEKAVNDYAAANGVAGYQPVVNLPSIGATQPAPQVSKTFDLALYTQADVVKKGTDVKFQVKTSQPCYLTLLNTDAKDKSQVLFPNPRFGNNRIDPGRVYDIPGADIGGFKFTANELGLERVVAICNASRAQVFDHDPAKQGYRVFDDQGALQKSLRNQKLLTLDLALADAPPPTIANPINPATDIIAQTAVVITVQ